jgi:hypothetical protein
MNFSPYSVLQHFHTHGHANTYYEATTPSEDFDVPFKNKLSSLYPDIIAINISAKNADNSYFLAIKLAGIGKN